MTDIWKFLHLYVRILQKKIKYENIINYDWYIFGVSRRIGITVAPIDEHLFVLKFWHFDGPQEPEIANFKSDAFWKIKWHYFHEHKNYEISTALFEIQ